MTEQEWMQQSLAVADPEVFEQIGLEKHRQHSRLELIASENFTSEAVLQATGSVFTNKYAEGYPGKRYYGGCEYADVVENLARDRAKQLFGAFAYVGVTDVAGWRDEALVDDAGDRFRERLEARRVGGRALLAPGYAHALVVLSRSGFFFTVSRVLVG